MGARQRASRCACERRRTVKRTKRWLRRRRQLYPAVLPSYLLPPNEGSLVFDPSLRRARDENLR
jgi:hypothetical protein